MVDRRPDERIMEDETLLLRAAAAGAAEREATLLMVLKLADIAWHRGAMERRQGAAAVREEMTCMATGCGESCRGEEEGW